jgi:hypothetical protein
MDRDRIIDALIKFKEENKHKYNIINIGVFGSAARNSMVADSDVDVVVILENQDLFSLIGIKQDLEERLKVSVDIVSYRDKMNAFLKGRIDKEAVYV